MTSYGPCWSEVSDVDMLGAAYVDRDGKQKKDVARAKTGSAAARRGGGLDEYFDLEHDHVDIARRGIGRREAACRHL